MLVLEATSERQGERSGDYNWCAEGELAYRQGIDCTRIDCGCTRGWAGFDSHRATTTVRVVDRPGFTVDKLAAALASSLCDGGWLQTPDPTDAMVADFVDEIIDCANHFGVGAVLERDGEWIRARDGTNGPVNPIDRVALEQLTDEIVEATPMATLAIASSTVHRAKPFVEPLIDALRSAQWPEAHTLGYAMEWLATGVTPAGWRNVPCWLTELDQAVVVAARRRASDDRTDLLLEIELPDLVLGTMWVLLRADGSLRNISFVDQDIAQFRRLLKALERGSSLPPFRKVSVNTARTAVVKACALSDTEPVEPPEWSSAPDHRALFDRVTESMCWAA